MPRYEEGAERLAAPAEPGERHERGIGDTMVSERGRGMAVINGSGAIVAADRAFRRLVGLRRRSGGGPLTCCTLLGCDMRRGARLGRCITERVLHSGETLHDVPVVLPGGHGAVLLSAAPLGAGREIAIVQLRPDAGGHDHGDDAARAPGLIRVRVLGHTEVETSDGIVVCGGWLDQRPGQLLKYLIAERGRVVPVEDIAEALWPSAGYATVSTVRHLVHVLRRQLDPDRRNGATHDGASYILSRRGGYALDEQRIILDANAFADAARLALDAFDAGDPAAERSLEEALRLYRGDFVGDEPYAAWAAAERERLRLLAGLVLQRLSDAAQGRGDVGTAAGYVERLAEFEPFDSAPQRELIVLSLRAGRRSRALRLYEAFDARMQRTFGERPEFSFEELMRAARP
jgi:DNA-binding SARP family transcriptional activator